MEIAQTNTPKNAQLALEAAGTTSSKLQRYRALVAEKSAQKEAVSGERIQEESRAASTDQSDKKASIGVYNLASDLMSEHCTGNVKKVDVGKENVDPLSSIRSRMKARRLSAQQSAISSDIPPNNTNASKTPDRIQGPNNMRTIRSPKPQQSFEETEIAYSSDDSQENYELERSQIVTPYSRDPEQSEEWKGSLTTASEKAGFEETGDEYTSSLYGLPEKEKLDLKAYTTNSGDTSGKSNDKDDQVVQQYPGELLSFHGVSFLNGTIEEEHTIQNNTKDNDALAPLMEGSDVEIDTPEEKASSGTLFSSPEVGPTPSRKSFITWEDEQKHRLDYSMVSSAQSNMSYSPSNFHKSYQGAEVEDDSRHSVTGNELPRTPDYSGGMDQLSTMLSQIMHTPEEDTINPSSPMTTLRKNAMQQALEESERYEAKIFELEKTLRQANADTEKEANRRKVCERQLQELSCDSIQYSPSALPITPFKKAESLRFEQKIQDYALKNEDTMSLFERNKTLVKEVRFADQTCVELGEKNAALQSEIDRLNTEMEKLGADNESLHDAVIRSAKHSSKMEAKNDANRVKLSEQRHRYEEEVQPMRDALNAAQQQIVDLNKGLDHYRNKNATLEANLTSSEQKVTLSAETIEEDKKMIAHLMSQLEASAASIAKASTDFSKSESYQRLKQHVAEVQQQSNEQIKLLRDIKREKDELWRDHSEIKDENVMLRGKLYDLENMYYESSLAPTNTFRSEKSSMSTASSQTKLEYATSLSMSEVGRNLLRRKREELVNAKNESTEDASAVRSIGTFSVEENVNHSHFDESFVSDVRQQADSSSQDGSSGTHSSVSEQLQYALEVNNMLTTTLSSHEGKIHQLEERLEHVCPERHLSVESSQKHIRQLEVALDTAQHVSASMEQEHSEVMLNLKKKFGSFSTNLMQNQIHQQAEIEKRIRYYSSRIHVLSDKVELLHRCLKLRSNSEDLQNPLPTHNTAISLVGNTYIGSHSTCSLTYSVEVNDAGINDDSDDVLNATFNPVNRSDHDASIVFDETMLERMEEARQHEVISPHDGDHQHLDLLSKTKAELIVSKDENTKLSKEIMVLRASVKSQDEALMKLKLKFAIEKENLLSMAKTQEEAIEAITKDAASNQDVLFKQNHSELNSMKFELESSLRQIEVHHDTECQYKDLIDRLESDLRERTDEIDRLKEAYAICNDKLAGNREKSAETEMAIAHSKASYCNVENELREKGRQLSDTLIEKDELWESHEHIEQCKNELDKQLKTTLDHHGQYKASSERRIAELQNVIAKLEIHDEERNNMMEQKLACIVEAKDTDLNHMRRQIQKLTDEVEIAERTSERAIDELNKKMERTQLALQTEKDKTSTLRVQSSEQQIHLNKLMNELFHCRAMVSALDDEAQKQMTKTNEGKMERERLNNEISCFRKKTENLQNHLTSQKSRGESIQVSLDDAIREMIPLKDEIISLQVEKEDIERDLASAKHECERLQAIVNEVKCARDCAVESLKLKDEEMKIITIQKVENSSKLQQQLNATEDSLLKKTQEAKNLVDKTESLERKCRKLRDYIKRLTSRCTEWKVSHEGQEEALRESHFDKERILGEVSDLTSQINLLHSERNNLETKKRCLEERIERMRDEVDHASCAQQSCSECKYLRKAIAREAKLVGTLTRKNQENVASRERWNRSGQIKEHEKENAPVNAKNTKQKRALNAMKSVEVTQRDQASLPVGDTRERAFLS
eukprot:CAMPEP_0198302844 /NCGR_PEP_ID=MMETSP1449-20131203/56577_1 /TAXON_ID=420275 /ORGANISM="Attheya septentrionalis, Strain CCMP2084" /LENGTH=1732 /DNA_ID=CAMNT_0044005315 /DNA_START=147 /DNA_END=5345 /DNA_ORIENTATION=-